MGEDKKKKHPEKKGANPQEDSAAVANQSAGENESASGGEESQRQANEPATGQDVVNESTGNTPSATVQPITPTNIYTDDISGIGERSADELVRVGNETADTIRSAGEKAAGDIRAINDGLYGKNGTVTIQQRGLKEYLENNAYKNIEQALTDYADQLKAAETEKNEEVKTDYRAATWTGLTELAASLVNLIGVGSGAVSQQYKSYSQDWMKKADADLKYHRSRIQNLRERQNALRMHIDQLKAADMKSLSDLAIRAAEKKADGEMRAAGIEADTAAKVAKIKGDTEQAAISARTKAEISDKELEARERLHKEDIAARERMNDADNEAKLAAYGIKKNADGTYTIPATGGKKGSSKAIPFTMNAYGTSLKMETIYIDPEALRTNVYTALASKSIKDLKKDDLDEIDAILNSMKGSFESTTVESAKEMAEKLIPYATKSAELRKILRNSGISTLETTESQNEGANERRGVTSGFFTQDNNSGDAALDSRFGDTSLADLEERKNNGGFLWSPKS